MCKTFWTGWGNLGTKILKVGSKNIKFESLKLNWMNLYFKNYYFCVADFTRQSNIGSSVSFKQIGSCQKWQGLFLFSKGFYRLLTFQFRLRIKRTPPKFQYFRQASVSNDLPVSTNDLPTVQNFLSDNAFDSAGEESLGFKKGQSDFFSN